MEGLTTGGYNDWGMPGISEYRTILDDRFWIKDCKNRPVLRLCPVFAEGGAYNFWSREERGSGFFCGVNFEVGLVPVYPRGPSGDGKGVRAVRSPGR